MNYHYPITGYAKLIIKYKFKFVNAPMLDNAAHGILTARGMKERMKEMLDVTKLCKN